MQYIYYKGFKIMLQGYLDGWLIVSVDEIVLKLPNFSALDTYLLDKMTNTEYFVTVDWRVYERIRRAYPQ